MESVARPCADIPAVSPKRNGNNATRHANRKGHAGDTMPTPISKAPLMTEALSFAAYNAIFCDTASDISSALVTSAKTKREDGVKEGGKQGRRRDALTTITTTDQGLVLSSVANLVHLCGEDVGSIPAWKISCR